MKLLTISDAADLPEWGPGRDTALIRTIWTVTCESARWCENSSRPPAISFNPPAYQALLLKLQMLLFYTVFTALGKHSPTNKSLETEPRPLG